MTEKVCFNYEGSRVHLKIGILDIMCMRNLYGKYFAQEVS